MKKLLLLLLTLGIMSCSTEQTEQFETANLSAKLENAIYLDSNLMFLSSDRNPTVVKFPLGIEPQQNMMIWVKKADGSFGPKYQIPANGEDGFPLIYSKVQNGIYLYKGDVCKLEFKWSGRFTGEFQIPPKGK